MTSINMNNYLYNKDIFNTIDTNNVLNLSDDDIKNMTCFETVNIISVIFITNNKYSKGLKYLELCITNNNKNAEYNLGQYYLSIEKDINSAISCFENVKDVIINANYKLGIIYKKLKQYNLAIECFMLLSDNSNAEYELGHCYMWLSDESKALEYFKLAADKNNINAAFMLGNQYSRNKDYTNAIKYYELAVKGNHINAMYKLGDLYCNIIYEDDEHLTLDEDYLTLGENYFIMACNKKHIGSLIEMGTRYLEDSGETHKGLYYLTMAYALTNNNNLKQKINNAIEFWEYGTV